MLKDHQIRGKKKSPPSTMWRTAEPLSCASQLQLQVSAPWKWPPTSLAMLWTLLTFTKTSNTFKSNFSLFSRLMVSKKTTLRNERKTKSWSASASLQEQPTAPPPVLTSNAPSHPSKPSSRIFSLSPSLSQPIPWQTQRKNPWNNTVPQWLPCPQGGDRAGSGIKPWH